MDTTHRPFCAGAWISKNIVGTPISPPPEDVPVIEPNHAEATTLKEQIEMHKSNKTCYACHKSIDPYGYAPRVSMRPDNGVLVTASKSRTNARSPIASRVSTARQGKSMPQARSTIPNSTIYLDSRTSCFPITERSPIISPRNFSNTPMATRPVCVNASISSSRSLRMPKIAA